MTRAAADPNPQPVDLDARRATRAARKPVAPPAPSGPFIKQRDVQDLVDLRADVKLMEKRLADAKKLAQDAELPLKLALSTKGYVIEPGPLAVSVKVDSRRVPKWRAEFEAVLGLDAAEAVVQRTAPTETFSVIISGA